MVVDVDLSRFFDRVNHDLLVDRLQKRIHDAQVLCLIHASLFVGFMGLIPVGKVSRSELTPRCW